MAFAKHSSFIYFISHIILQSVSYKTKMYAYLAKLCPMEGITVKLDSTIVWLQILLLVPINQSV